MKLKIPPLLLVLIAALAMWALARWLPWGHFAFPGQAWIAALPVLAGVAVAAQGVLAFRRAATTVDPMHPDRASRLVIAGIYHRTRNPMYLGFLLALLGFGIYLGNAVSFVVLPLFVAYMNRFQIGPEEDALSQRFGEDYRRYVEQVRRWL